jgi:hypothetical protein
LGGEGRAVAWRRGGVAAEGVHRRGVLGARLDQRGEIALVELATLAAGAPQVEAAGALVLGLVDRGYAEVYRWLPEGELPPPGELLSRDQAAAALGDRANWGERPVEFWASATPAGRDAYKRAALER